MHKKQQDRKLRKNPFTPQLFERFFRRNEGTTDYATIPAVTLSGDFAISGNVLISGVDFHQIFSGTSSTFNIRTDAAGNGIALTVSNTTYIFSGVSFTRDVFNSFSLSRIGGNVTIEINGISESQAIPISNFIIERLYRDTTFGTSSPLPGILANLRIYDNGTLVRDYPLDDNTSDLREKVSGQTGTLINGTTDQWALYQQQVTGEYLGPELVVNGGFGTDSDWVKGAGCTIAGGVASFDGSLIPLATGFSQSSLVLGLTYRSYYEITSHTSGDVVLKLGNTLTTSRNTVGSFTEDGTTILDGTLRLSAGAATPVASIDNVSVKEVLNVA